MSISQAGLDLQSCDIDGQPETPPPAFLSPSLSPFLDFFLFNDTR